MNISFRTVKEQGRAKFYLANWQDITERKKIEEAIRESEAFNSSLLNDAPNPVLVYNLDDSVRYVNPATEQLTGYSSREMIGAKPPYPWWPPHQAEQFLIEKKASRNHVTEHMERQARKKNGELIWLSIGTCVW